MLASFRTFERVCDFRNRANERMIVETVLTGHVANQTSTTTATTLQPKMEWKRSPKYDA